MVRCFIFSLMFFSAFGMENDKIFSENALSESAKVQIFEPKASEFVSLFNFLNDVKGTHIEFQDGFEQFFNLYLKFLNISSGICLIVSCIDFNNLPEGDNNELRIAGSMPELPIELPLFQEMTDRVLTENDEKILSLIPKKEVVSLAYEKAETAAKHFKDFRDYFTDFMLFQNKLALKMEQLLSMISSVDAIIAQSEDVDPELDSFKKKRDAN